MINNILITVITDFIRISLIASHVPVLITDNAAFKPPSTKFCTASSEKRQYEV